LYAVAVRNDRRVCAFTLAEVLITLTIIGVIAAITIPNLMKNYQTHIFKTAYKQAYADINQAFAQAFKDGELTETNNLQILKENLKVSKECKSGDLYSCWAQGDTVCGGTCDTGQKDENGEYIYGEGAPRVYFPSFIDTSGRSWSCTDRNNRIYVDTNGFKGPNHFGKDRFVFMPYSAKNTKTTDYSTNPPVRMGPFENRNITVKHSYCKFPPCYYYDWLYK